MTRLSHLKSRVLAISVAALAAVLFSTQVHAQATTSSIRVEVTDESGSRVGGVPVTMPRGWYRERSPEEKNLVRRYLARADNDIVWDFIRMAMASAACFAVIPFQDVLNLDSDARMNTPAILGGNWTWRYRPEALNSWSSDRLRELVDLYGRDPKLWLEQQFPQV